MKLRSTEVGRTYETGVGVLQDKQEAFKWYLKAAYQGDKMAERKLGRFYEDLVIHRRIGLQRTNG